MDYLYKLRSAVSTVKSTVESALPGNPVSREYEITKAVASAGPGLCWTIYDGYKRSTKQEVSVWWLDKRHIDKWPPRDRDLFLEITKRGIQQLTRLRHPRLLVVEHALEEAKDSLAFCTEPVWASLANILNPPSVQAGGFNEETNSISPAAAADLKDVSLEDIEIKMGLKEVVEALKFLHFDARIIHRNLRPEAIIVTKRGAWKLAGFEFCLSSVSSPDQPPSYPNVDYDTQCPSFARPQLDFSSPELPLGGRVDVASDIYALGLVCFSIFNKGRKLFQYRDEISTFKKNSDDMKTLPSGKLNSIPVIIRDDLKLCLQFTPELRPDAAQLLLLKYFDDPNVKTLANLENLRLMDGLEKANFFKALPTTFPLYPKRVITRRVVPALADEMRVHPQTVPLVLPSILQAIELLDQSEFAKFALPTLEPIVQLERAYQAWHLILQRVDLLMSKMSMEDARRLLVPMACNALESDSSALQESCAQCLHKLTTLIDSETMRKRIVPRLLNLATELNVLSVRVNALLCLGRMLENLEKWQVTEQILPQLAKIQSRDPAILMAVLGVFRVSFNCAKLGGLGRDVCAKVCLPFLVTSCVEQALNGRQFEAFMSLIRDMLNKVESEQRRRLEQAPSPNPDSTGAVINNNHTGTGLASMGSSDKLASLASTQSKSESGKRGGSLSLEEKRRLAAEQEKTLQFRQSAPLEPISSSAGMMTSPQSKDNTSLSGFLPSPPASSSGALGGVLMPLSSPPSQSTFQQQHHQPKSNSSDPFASLNVFSTSSASPSSTGPARSITPVTSAVAQTQPQLRMHAPQWTPGVSLGRPPPQQTLASMIPPPPAPAPGTSVRTPTVGTGLNWNQSSLTNATLNSVFTSGPQKKDTPTSKPKAQDELADFLG